ncbi:restriction endonuclease subunit S [Tenacibaculum finnmarkense]|uniref:restriction endonuclease subunit S n=1 Tax=Tenacibaculum finnmarkense TaxID=2781243 RepID=UPI001E4D06CC|nr:restriction endonuclease subunit S [Tenacibaculum finnmarkense]MCD8445991.1 restriction endonuclease subunit S [Tenacibaculum finnmarkense genomovar finnmarkense]
MSLSIKNIPSNWELKNLGDVCDFTQGTQIPFKEQISTLKDGYIRYLYIRDFFTDDFKCYVKNEYPNKIMKEDDIMMINTGNTAGGVYRGAFGVLCNNAFKINTNEDILLKDYLFIYLTSSIYKNVIRRYFNYGGQPHVGHKNVAKIPINIPPLKEQQKIAKILSTWDEAIETTQSLIEKLQFRKKGLMQELLSGKKRLAGFSEEWEILRGDELFASISNKKHDGKFEVLSATQDKGVIPRSETGINIKYDKKSLGNYKKIEIGDFVISLRSFQGGIEYSNYEGLVSPAYTVLRENLPIAKRFYQEYMKTENFINRLNSIIYGIRDGKQISYKEFGSLKFEYPPLSEQKAISKIIDLSDIEISEKKAYLLQLKNQKKGLMQQLLTGKKRVKL